MAITAAYGFMGKYVKYLDSSRLGFAPPAMERYTQALSVLRCPSSSGQTLCDLITGMPEHETRKENKTGNEVTCMVDKFLIHRNAINLTSGVCDISRSNRNSTRQLEVHSNIYSCGYRGQYGCPRLRC